MANEQFNIIRQMPELDDHELLVEFARTESEAFATIVQRYVRLVVLDRATHGWKLHER